MYRKEVNERSPMRVFEKSMHGGLGAGNVGVVVSRPGVGKSALLCQIALDDLLRGRRVLHISHEHPVDRVRAFYDQLFHDLAISHQLAQPQVVRLEAERNRLLYSHLGNGEDAPMSVRGGSSSISKIEETIQFARDVAHFEPDAVIVDGFDFQHASTEAVETLGKIAKKLNAELWLSAKTTERPSADEPPVSVASPASAPTPVRRFFDLVNVLVQLCPHEDTVRIQLLKDHDNPDLTELHLRLDPTTMRVIDEDLPPKSDVPKAVARFHLFSGGAKGAESTFGQCAERWGLQETHYSFAKHPFSERTTGRVELSEDELQKGDFSLVYASHRLGRPLSHIPGIKGIMQTAWHQITAANEVFVVGAIQDNGTVRGGTGWGAELARLWHKPVHVFDQEKNTWYAWDATHWREEPAPIIHQLSFAGIGTTKLTPQGKAAIEELFERTFGTPASSES